MQRSTIILMVAAWILAAISAVQAQYDDGDGSAEFPYQIAEPNQLIYMSEHPEHWSQHFILTADINLALADPNAFTTALIAPDTDDSLAWYQGTSFTGKFNGNGYIISNLIIDDAGAENDYLGLFGRTEGSVKNLGIHNCTIIGGNGSRILGGLCGENRGVITNCYTTGKVTGGTHSWRMGGLCGYQLANINNCYSTVQVTGGNSSRQVGGLCGYNDEGIINNCYATGSVIGSFYLGGLCGENSGNISNCYTIGVVANWDNSNFIGSLCGYNEDGVINNSYFYVLSGLDNGIGTALDDLQIQDSASFIGFDFAGNPNDGEDDYWAIVNGHIPKLTWQTDDGPVRPNPPVTTLTGRGFAYDPFQINSYADFTEFRTNSNLFCGYYILQTDIDLSGETFSAAVINRTFGGHFDGDDHVIQNITIDNVGASIDNLGLFKKTIASVSNLGIENIHITGGENSRNLGGLCGSSTGIINNCYAQGSITGGFNSDFLGGLCGGNNGTIINCHTSGEVTSNWDDSDYLGGLCGNNREGSIITNCYTTCSVTSGRGADYLGGLCGYNNTGIITNSYATGSVTGEDNSRYLGGLCGLHYEGTITNCYATGSVNGGEDSLYLGGLSGYNNNGNITNCYASGSVAGGEGSRYLGGLCGEVFDGAITNCFWDIEYGGPDNGKGTPLTNSEMKQQSSFVDWDFDPNDGDPADWLMPISKYPKLYWQSKIDYYGQTTISLGLSISGTIQINIYRYFPFKIRTYEFSKE